MPEQTHVSLSSMVSRILLAHQQRIQSNVVVWNKKENKCLWEVYRDNVGMLECKICIGITTHNHYLF